MHKLEQYDIDTMQGVCSECGPVQVIRKIHRARKNPTYICAIAKKQQARPSSSWNYKTHDGTIIRLNGRQYDELMAKYGESCNICGATGKLVLDHDHATGAWRGALCKGCNLALGLFRDDPSRFRSAIDYLSR